MLTTLESSLAMLDGEVTNGFEVSGKSLPNGLRVRRDDRETIDWYADKLHGVMNDFLDEIGSNGAEECYLVRSVLAAFLQQACSIAAMSAE